MRFIIGIAVFWLSIIGISFFLNRKLKLKEYFALPLTTAVIGIVMFLAGILNILKLTSILIILFSIYSIITSIIKKEINLDTVKDFFRKPANIIIIIVFAYISIMGATMHVTHYDNFSHWGLIIKNMFMNNSLPNFDDLTIMFKGYQPGSASYIYYFGLLCGKTEGTMIIGNNYMVFSFVTILYSVLKNQKKLITQFIPALFYVFLMVISNNFNELLVDGLLAVLSLATFIIMYEYRKDLKKAALYSLPLLVFQYLVKNTGVVLIGFNCLYFVYLILKNKEIKKGLKYIFVIGMTLFMFLSIWQSHVTYAYGAAALNSKHSLSTENILTQVRDKGWGKILGWTKSYIKHFVDIKNNQAMTMIIVINVIVILAIIYEKNKNDKKHLIHILLALDGLYVGYYCVLGLMYILSMPWGEAVVFASYERYMSTILIIIVGILIYTLFLKKKTNVVGVVLLVLLMSVTMVHKSKDLLPLIGKENYENTFIEKYDKFFPDVLVDGTKMVYVYAPSSINDHGFLYHLSIYKLNVPYVKVITSSEDLGEIDLGTLIILESDESIKSKVSELSWTEKKENVFTK